MTVVHSPAHGFGIVPVPTFVLILPVGVNKIVSVFVTPFRYNCRMALAPNPPPPPKPIVDIKKYTSQPRELKSTTLYLMNALKCVETIIGTF
jgi:hypothetical protein